MEHNNNNNNNRDYIYGTVIMASHYEGSPGLFDEYSLSAGWPPTRDQANQLVLSPPSPFITVLLS